VLNKAGTQYRVGCVRAVYVRKGAESTGLPPQANGPKSLGSGPAYFQAELSVVSALKEDIEEMADVHFKEPDAEPLQTDQQAYF
jgi:hypothetical protein